MFKGAVLGSASAILAVLVANAVPLAAVAEERSEFAIIASDRLEVGDIVTKQDLLEMGISMDAVDVSRQNLDAPISEPSSMQPTYNAWGIGDEWWDSSYRWVVLRNGSWSGSTGWGWKKIWNYHNLTSRSMKAVTRNYFRYEREGSTNNYRYFARALRFSCGITCYVSDARDVKLVVDRRVLSDGKTRGIFNGYCVQSAARCPNWVNRALSVR